MNVFAQYLLSKINLIQAKNQKKYGGVVMDVLFQNLSMYFLPKKGQKGQSENFPKHNARVSNGKFNLKFRRYPLDSNSKTGRRFRSGFLKKKKKTFFTIFGPTIVHREVVARRINRLKSHPSCCEFSVDDGANFWPMMARIFGASFYFVFECLRGFVYAFCTEYKQFYFTSEPVRFS